MKRHIVLLAFVSIYFFAAMVKLPLAYAETKEQVLQSFKNFEDKYPHASSYYDDKEDHYEHDQLMRDEIARGIH